MHACVQAILVAVMCSRLASITPEGQKCARDGSDGNEDAMAAWRHDTKRACALRMCTALAGAAASVSLAASVEDDETVDALACQALGSSCAPPSA